VRSSLHSITCSATKYKTISCQSSAILLTLRCKVSNFIFLFGFVEVLSFQANKIIKTGQFIRRNENRPNRCVLCCNIHFSRSYVAWSLTAYVHARTASIYSTPINIRNWPTLNIYSKNKKPDGK
jgi:hypothetical protein